MIRFGKLLGTLDHEVECIKIMNDADPKLYEAILNGDKKIAERLVKELFENHCCITCGKCKKRR